MPNLPEEPLTSHLPERELAKLRKTYIDETYFDAFIKPNVIYKDAVTGKPQMLWLTNVIPLELQAQALSVFQHKSIATPGTASYRESAAGPHPGQAGSGIIGFFDRTRESIVCRQTAFNLNHAGLFEQALPYIRAVDKQFQIHFPEQWQHQMFAAMFTQPEWIISGTSFSTLTINKNFRTALHKDAGDLKGSFGVMTVFSTPGFTGGDLVFPKYRVAIPYGNGDIVFANVHEWHANTEIFGEPDTYERLSCVFYQRQRIVQCGSKADELKRVRERAVGDPLFGWVLKGIKDGKRNTFFVAENHEGELDFEDPVSDETDEFPEDLPNPTNT
jgi:hypothetical protein